MVITLESVMMIVLVIAALEVNLTYFYENLDSVNALQYFPTLTKWILPYGEQNPLIILGKKFMPIKLLSRSLSIMILLLYVFLDNLKQVKLVRNLKWFLLFTTLTMLVIFPTILTILTRHYGLHHELAHDGGTIQIEEAVKLLLQGRNPYAETYAGTPLEFWRGFKNNAVYHYPYPPFSFLFSIPFYLVSAGLLGWFDQRFVYLLFYVANLVLVSLLFSASRLRRIAVMWVGLNPLLLHLFALGSSDVATTGLLLAALVLHQRRYYRAGVVTLALACSYKQFAVFLVPFTALELWREHGLDRRAQVKLWALFMAVVALLNLPFLLWSPRDFYEDTILYSSGGLPTSYQIQGFHGYGFGSFLLFFRVVPNGNGYYPFWLWQAVVVLPLMSWGLFRQYGAANLASKLFGFSITLLAFMFFSRYLNGNFLGFILTWPIVAWISVEQELETGADSARMCFENKPESGT